MDITQQAEQVIREAASDQSEFDFNGSASPERIAWIALLGAFLLFCIVTLSTIFGVYHYLFRSTVAMPTVLEVAKGTVGITGADLIEAVEREREELTNTVTSVSTDSLSQATIQFRVDDKTDAESAALLAAVTLQGNTFVTFNYAHRPRFEWSKIPQRVQFSRLSGELDIVVTGIREDPFVMDVYTDALNSGRGLHIQLASNGRYRVNVSEDEVRFLTLTGEAIAFFQDEPDLRNTVRIGQELVIRIGNRSSNAGREDTKNLLVNGDFSLQSTSIGQMYFPGEPPNWNCSGKEDQDPPGAYSLVNYDGRVGMNLRRHDNATSHGEISCIQVFEEPGLDARELDSLRVLATFSLNQQSLSLCGKLGSECPLMLHINYKTVEPEPNNNGDWFRGFYYEEVSSGSYKQICASCLQDHVDTNQAVWYTYDSGNLLNLISEDDRPAFIRSMRFYASGHQFDTVVSEIMLLANGPVFAGGGG